MYDIIRKDLHPPDLANRLTYQMMEDTSKTNFQAEPAEHSEQSTTQFNHILLNTTYQFKKAKRVQVRTSKSAFPELQREGKSNPFDDSKIKKPQGSKNNHKQSHDQLGVGNDLLVRANPLNSIKYLFGQHQVKPASNPHFMYQKIQPQIPQNRLVGLRSVKISSVK